MRKILLLSITLLIGIYARAQKPAIAFNDFSKWDVIYSTAVTDDFHYFFYIVRNSPQNSNDLIIEDVRTKWRKVIKGVNEATFITDNKRIVYITNSGNLCTLVLGSEKCVFVPDVLSYEVHNKIWMTYRKKSIQDEVILRNLLTGKEQLFSAVSDCRFSGLNNNLLLYKNPLKNIRDDHELQLIDLDTHESKTIWTGRNASKFIFDATGRQLVFLSNLNENKPAYNIWYYKVGMANSVLLANDQTKGIGQTLTISNTELRFSNSGNLIFFVLKQTGSHNTKLTGLDIWNYKDEKLQSEQLSGVKNNHFYDAVISLGRNHQIIQIEQGDEDKIGLSEASYHEFALVERCPGSSHEINWNPASKPVISLVSLAEGTRQMLNMSVDNSLQRPQISPNGKYVIYYDSNEKNYFVYDIKNKVYRNITRDIPTVWTLENYDQPATTPAYSLYKNDITWLEQDRALIISDNYDLWKIDPERIDPAINITNGLGRRKHLEFKVGKVGDEILTSKNKLILTAFDPQTKQNGFFSQDISLQKDPDLLSMGPYQSELITSEAAKSAVSLEKKKGGKYIVTRQSAAEAPNYFFTSDFKSFKPLTFISPEKAYNWLTAELINWKTFDGTESQGVLYKPENFDPHKKYPLIFTYYEQSSFNLNHYFEPGFDGATINIPYFVSKGYLVFTPDIHYKIGYPGKSAFNSIVSAAKFLCKNPWVDSTKMGLQGHSFGGFETAYLITHTNIFAAAMCSSGMYDFVSCYGSIIGTGFSRQGQYEYSRDRIGATLWQRPDLYIENSPVYLADKVVTPVLLMANKNDDDVPFAQGVELFTALRRLGKKAWMLQYDDEGHSLNNAKNNEDYITRIEQFFDHYLKEGTPPKWMTVGVPARLKGIDDGLSPDTSGRQP